MIQRTFMGCHVLDIIITFKKYHIVNSKCNKIRKTYKSFLKKVYFLIHEPNFYPLVSVLQRKIS